MMETLIAANLIISIIGALILGRWIYALKGTIDAQAATITTIKQVNETVVQVFMALDPERWAKEIKVHKEFADRKAAAIVEEMERKFREKKSTFTEQAKDRIRTFVENYEAVLGLVIRFMAWVPGQSRVELITGMNLPDSVKKTLTDAAREAPEPTVALRMAYGYGKSHLLEALRNFKDFPPSEENKPR